MSNEAAEHILSIFLPLIQASEAEITTLGTVIPIPRFEPDNILELCRAALAVLKTQPHVLRLDPPVFILGDIHGDLHDLLRVFSKIPDITKTRILLLGDYIDRGGFSTEVIVFLFALIAQYPNNVYLLRGNHEFPNVLNVNILDIELSTLYGKTPLFEEVQNVFTYLPLAAVIGNAFFAVHGGLSQSLNSPEDIMTLQYPITDLSNKLVEDILWSDPCGKITGFLDSTRGRGVLFGAGAALNFLETNNFKMLIRAHQCVINGISLFNDCVITVFTTSYYNSEENKGAFILINENLEISSEILTPLRAVRRQQAFFANAPTRKKLSRPIARSLLAAQTKTTTGRCAKPPLARPRPRANGINNDIKNSNEKLVNVGKMGSITRFSVG